MNKSELIDIIAKEADISKAAAAKAAEAVIKGITTTLKKGGQVRLIGFGTFKVTKRKATTGRDPRTGTPINIPASNQPKFSAGKALKAAVN